MNRKNIYDTWALTDSLGRSAPCGDSIYPVRDRKIGMFYFLWHDNDGPVYDHTKAYLDGGVPAVWDMLTKGNLGYAHYWGQPHFGYYRSDDEWVIRKHAYMLAAAGVDFIFFDTSNGIYFPEASLKIMEVFSKMRTEGVKVPQFVYFNGDIPENNLKTVTGEYDLIYKDGKYKDLWFMYGGKPLMFANTESIKDKEILDFFTFKRSWAFTYHPWYTDNNGKNCWPWADFYPQKPGLGENGEIEQMIVMSGFWANGSGGRSLHNGIAPTAGNNDFEFSLMESTTPLGLGYQESFDYAKKTDPPIIMITGWNEWWAGRWDNKAAQGQSIANTYTVDISAEKEKYRYHYVDAFNTEFSRDIEPMRGGYRDNYYCQTVKNVREYKGTNPLPKSNGKKTVNTLSDFDSVEPTFYDYLYETGHRAHKGSGRDLFYTNTTGRNDIDFAKVCRDDEYVFFMVKTREKMTDPDGFNWMNLFINTAPGYCIGWEGYSFLINRYQYPETGMCSVERTNSGWNFQIIGKAKLLRFEDALIIKVPNEMLCLGRVPVKFDFKWADNSVLDGDVMDFYDKGDAAPFGRFNFRYCEDQKVY